MTDTLAYSKRLQEAGVPASQAEAHASAAYEFFSGMVATKGDIANIETRLAGNIANVETRLATLATKADLADLKGSITLAQWMAATAIAVALANIGLTVAVLTRIAALLK